MATVNFSVPEQVKKLFNATFSGKNKSQVIADLMLKAVEEQRRRKRRVKAVDALLALRRKLMPVMTRKSMLPVSGDATDATGGGCQRSREMDISGQ